jgi:predicted ArsR family transcriptional regulator
MTLPSGLELAILKDLIAGQSSADSTADRLRIEGPAAQIIMDRLTSAGLLETFWIMNRIRVYRLTAQTRQALADLNRPTAPQLNPQNHALSAKS